MMDFELVTVRPDVTLGAVHRFLRLRKTIPAATDKLFVTDRKNTLLGELPLTAVLLNDPETPVQDVMDSDPTRFLPEDRAEAAASAFERYDLISAPVVDAKGKLMGRLTIEEIVDVVNEESDTTLRRMGGLSPDEDVFAPVMKAVKTRWAWLAINLCTAFIASRVIGMFEHTISQLVALAALMPIVAGIGGNTGNQTITMIVRALALRQIEVGNISRLMLRELGVAIINGVVWGGIMGVVTWLLYGDWAMGGVMTLAMILNLLVAALMGVVIPMTMIKMGRDPAVGSSVLITALTDTGGFFIFLGLATLFLL
jgi:magnesium transporter